MQVCAAGGAGAGIGIVCIASFYPSSGSVVRDRLEVRKVETIVDHSGVAGPDIVLYGSAHSNLVSLVSAEDATCWVGVEKRVGQTCDWQGMC